MRLARRPSIPAIVAIAAVVGFVLWLVLRGGGGEHEQRPAAQVSRVFAATEMSPTELSRFARGSSMPIYWAGRRPGTKLEVTATGSGRVFVRYLRRSAPIGSRAPYLTVATYPYPNGARALRIVGRHRGTLHDLPHGGVLLADVSDRTSVLLSYPGAQYEVEVYDPRTGLAGHLALAGRIAPVR